MTFDRETLRPSFEQWATENLSYEPDFSRESDGAYARERTSIAWQAWCAALAGLTLVGEAHRGYIGLTPDGHAMYSERRPVLIYRMPTAD